VIDFIAKHEIEMRSFKLWLKESMLSRAEGTASEGARKWHLFKKDPSTKRQMPSN
jgi:hypothetical protein